MKKTYERSFLTTEQFDVEDIITASSGSNPAQYLLHQVGDLMENMLDMFDSTGN